MKQAARKKPNYMIETMIMARAVTEKNADERMEY